MVKPVVVSSVVARHVINPHIPGIVTWGSGLVIHRVSRSPKTYASLPEDTFPPQLPVSFISILVFSASGCDNLSDIAPEAECER